ncbi:MAG: entericidin A/B family lipoprotein [Betaproteobacteria bacterium]|nr:entericidin A/B family lipoprotein [Betaproteobacteria bacterium]
MKILSTMIILTTVLYLTACNTMAGVGKDIQKGGEALERSAQ